MQRESDWHSPLHLPISRTKFTPPKGQSMRRFVMVAFPLALAASLGACSHSKKPKIVSTLAPARVTTIGVNAYLWQASLDTLAFMPIAQVDSNGGVIITDWYATPQVPNERVKVSVSILDTVLRADAIRVNVTRQTLGGAGWVEAPVRAGTVQKLEEAILARARDLRQVQLPG